MSKYITENSLEPSEAMLKGLQAGAGAMHINFNNGAIEVTHSDGSVLMQAKNVSEGTNKRLWAILENCGDIDYRAGR
jgi:hypothetical protein